MEFLYRSSPRLKTLSELPLIWAEVLFHRSRPVLVRPEVAAEFAGRADEGAVGGVVVAEDQAADALIGDADEGVADHHGGGCALVVDAALVEAAEAPFDLPDGP